VAYSVPTNQTATREDLISFYDSNAQILYQNFTYSLQQIPCNTTSSAQYSLARNCTDCARDYKSWLCAVTIPRCDDISAVSKPYLMPRNLQQGLINGTSLDLGAVGLPANSTTDQPWMDTSRFGPVDDVIKPGPYRELLPCIDVCYELVKSCPASLGFGCPMQEDMIPRSYGTDDGQLTCNRVGSDQPGKSGAGRMKVSSLWMMVLICMLWIM
jgi:calcium channel MID1